MNHIEVSELIKNRKSTFVPMLKEGGKIDDSVVEELLDNAIWAPSHGLVQAWDFKVFADDAVKRFFEVQQEIYKKVTPADKFNEMKYKLYADKYKKVSHIIAIIARRDPEKKHPKQEDIVSVAMAVQNIYLSLESLGIGGYLSTGNLAYSELMRKFLELNEDDEPIGFFMLGIPENKFKLPPRIRIPAKEKTVWFRK